MNETQLQIIKQQLFLKGFEESHDADMLCIAIKRILVPFYRFVHKSDGSRVLYSITTESWMHIEGFSFLPALKVSGRGFESLIEYLRGLKYAHPIPESPYTEFEGKE